MKRSSSVASTQETRARKVSGRSVLAVAALSLFIGGVAGTTAHASNFSAEVTGAQALTSSYYYDGELIERARVSIEDTDADDKQAEADYYRGSSTNRQNVAADDGYGDLEYSGWSQTQVTQMRACTRNSNPFDGDNCSNWEYS